MREKEIHHIEVHVAAVCVSQGTEPIHILGLRRASTRILFPNYWEGVGGQVCRGESFEEAVLTHLREEASIQGQVVFPFAVYTIEPGPESGATERIPGVRFLVTVEGTPKITIDPEQHQDYAWIPVTKLGQYKWIPRLRLQIEAGIRTYQRLSSGQLP